MSILLQIKHFYISFRVLWGLRWFHTEKRWDLVLAKQSRIQHSPRKHKTQSLNETQRWREYFKLSLSDFLVWEFWLRSGRHGFSIELSLLRTLDSKSLNFYEGVYHGKTFLCSENLFVHVKHFALSNLSANFGNLIKLAIGFDLRYCFTRRWCTVFLRYGELSSYLEKIAWSNFAEVKPLYRNSGGFANTVFF